MNSEHKAETYADETALEEVLNASFRLSIFDMISSRSSVSLSSSSTESCICFD